MTSFDMEHRDKENLSSNDNVFGFSIPGDPIPLQRARHGNKMTWDPQKQIKEELRQRFTHYYPNHVPWEGPLGLEVTFYMKVPISLSPKNAQAKYNKPHIFKPDLSNLIKFVEDAFNGILHKDDSLFAKITASKVYTHLKPRTDVVIRKIEK